MLVEKVKTAIRDIPDFPEPGIVFKDITPILSKPDLVKEIVTEMQGKLEFLSVDAIACIESRGFWFGTLLAYQMGLPIVPIRKKGKLPYQTISVDYDLEYGSASIEVHDDAIAKGDRILVHDDLLATGGTAAATAQLVSKSGGEIAGFSFLVDLTFLNGSEKLTSYSDEIISMIDY